MQTILHKNDLSNGINFSSIVAADCEMMGLQPNRDPLCLIQLYDGTGDCHLVQFIDQKFDAPNLKKLLASDKTFIFHYLLFALVIDIYLQYLFSRPLCNQLI